MDQREQLGKVRVLHVKEDFRLPLDPFEERFQARDSLARKARMKPGPGVQAVYLVRGEVAQAARAVCRPVHGRVMEDVENAVPAGAHVHLNVVRAPFDALPGRRPRVLRRDGVRPPVADDLYPMRRHFSPSSSPESA